MTRMELEKYHDITVRLKSLKTEIVTDSVKGSMDEYPFTSRSVTLHGIRSDEKSKQEGKLLTEQKNAIDGFIDGITDVRAKTLLDMHYRKGWSWCKIAHETGKSMEANKKYLKRFWMCTLLSPNVPI